MYVNVIIFYLVSLTRKFYAFKTFKNFDALESHAMKWEIIKLCQHSYVFATLLATEQININSWEKLVEKFFCEK